MSLRREVQLLVYLSERDYNNNWWWKRTHHMSCCIIAHHQTYPKYSRRIMMKRLPIRTIPIPIKPRPHTLSPNTKILTQLVNHHFKRLRSLRLFTNQMCPLMPTLPFGPFDILCLKCTHFGDEFVVDVPIGFGAE